MFVEPRRRWNRAIVLSGSRHERFTQARYLSEGFTSMATLAALGTSSCSSSNCFAASTVLNTVAPVRLPPG